MKPVILFIIICVFGYFVWQSTNQTIQPRIVKPPVLTEPPPLPTGKALSDQYKTLIVGTTIYNDVIVRTVFPDSIAIIHRDGAITIPLADVPKEIQRKYSYDPTYAAEYISLKAAHAQYKKDKAKEAEEKLSEKQQNKITSGEDKPTPAPSAVTSPTRQPQVARMPGTLRMLISMGNENLARTEFEKYLRTASRLEARGTVLRHLDDGHLLVKGSVGDPKTRGINYQTYLLFGLPEADRLADGDTFDAFAVMGDAIETAGGARMREYIFVDEGGRRPVRFARNSGIYD